MLSGRSLQHAMLELSNTQMTERLYPRYRFLFFDVVALYLSSMDLTLFSKDQGFWGVTYHKLLLFAVYSEGTECSLEAHL